MNIPEKSTLNVIIGWMEDQLYMRGPCPCYEEDSDPSDCSCSFEADLIIVRDYLKYLSIAERSDA